LIEHRDKILRLRNPVDSDLSPSRERNIGEVAQFSYSKSNALLARPLQA